MQTDKRIENNMTTKPLTVSKETGVKKAQQMLKAGDFRHLPVVEGGRVVGVVSDRDLSQAVALSDRAELTVGDVMIRDPYCVPQGTPLISVLKEMAMKKYGCAIVLGRKDEVSGIFTRRDALWILIGMLEKEPHESIRKGLIENYFFPNYLV